MHASNLPALTPEVALEQIKSGHLLSQKHVEGKIHLQYLGGRSQENVEIDFPIHFDGCELGDIEGHLIAAQAPVIFEDTVVQRLGLYSWFFFKGLTISRCTFHQPVDFLWGGHNKSGPVIIEDTTFHEFVNFYDSWFMGPVILNRVCFKKGSNLLGMKGKPYVVTFDVPPEINDCLGNIEMDIEADRA